MGSGTETKPAGYVVGTWDLDPVHSEASFVVRHMVVSKVRGHFAVLQATVTTDEDPLRSTVDATIEAGSITTGNPQRDAHLRSADFLDVEHYPTITFRSNAIRPDGDAYLLDGDLTIRGVTRPVTLQLEPNGFSPDPYGGTRAGFSASGEIDRTDFSVAWNGPIPGTDSAVVLGEKVRLVIEAELVLRTDDPEAAAAHSQG